MQPYLFPYVGYFQLIDSVDEFVLYDNVNFIKKGWINRNNIAVNGRPHLFSVPVKNKSQNLVIRDVEIDNQSFSKWRKKFLKTLQMSYGKAQNFDQAFEIVNLCLSEKSHISALCRDSLTILCEYLEIKANISEASSLPVKKKVGKVENLVGLCNHLGATKYINAPSGKSLYDKEAFSKRGISLEFLQPSVKEYTQTNSKFFMKNLSVIDIIMNCKRSECKDLISGYSISS